MSKESAKEFIGRLLDDDDFLTKIASTKSGGERRRKAEAEGFDFTADELQEAKAEHLAAAGETTRKPPKSGDVQPLYGVVDTWDA